MAARSDAAGAETCRPSGRTKRRGHPPRIVPSRGSRPLEGLADRCPMDRTASATSSGEEDEAGSNEPRPAGSELMYDTFRLMFWRAGTRSDSGAASLMVEVTIADAVSTALVAAAAGILAQLLVVTGDGAAAEAAAEIAVDAREAATEAPKCTAVVAAAGTPRVASEAAAMPAAVRTAAGSGTGLAAAAGPRKSGAV
ncbi:hypothetical protein VaNZ11_017042 [Volvox africanus]|uniref:VAN3-binding protein-like auxin canalisation domain-containing protein n=1 Tax=Volvox africanus TaxID=51714 RepID=A0ABQ5SQT3_9CHLO|nr:hypothetical protein VaNZ11_017042 [Volvox africanus]